MYYYLIVELKSNTNESNISFSIIAVFDTGADWIWDNHNKGKLWKDIKHKYETEE